jgi:Trk K+ transport system NAD-binding subunit
VIGVEMVDEDNREHLLFAGADALVNDTETIANLLVRSVQDIGVSDVICELIASEVGCEIYRVPVEPAFVGKAWRDYASALVDRRQSALGLARDGTPILNPDPDEPLRVGDEAFLVAPEPPLRRG